MIHKSKKKLTVIIQTQIQILKGKNIITKEESKDKITIIVQGIIIKITK